MGSRFRNVLVNADAVALYSRKQVVNFFRRVFPSRKDLVHFVEKEKSAILAQIYQITDLLVLFLHDGRQMVFSNHNSRRFRVGRVGSVHRKPTSGKSHTYVARNLRQLFVDTGPSQLPRYGSPGRHPAQFH